MPAEENASWYARIVGHLESGGVVKVSTRLRATLYKSKHKDYFALRNGKLFVRSGRRLECLGPDEAPWVGIQLGR